jgi:hypothetical protein
VPNHMRKIGPIFGIAALAAVVFSPLPAAAFGFHLGPFHFHSPFGHHHHHHAYMHSRASRTRPNHEVARGGSYGAAVAAREARTEINAKALESCTGLASGVTNPPINQIRQTIHLTTDQEAALDDLAAALSRARDIIRSSCQASVPLTPLGRLDSAELQLNANIKAIGLVRSPLERFYRALNDDQKRQLDTMTGSADGRPAGVMAGLCTRQGGFIDLPVQQIEEVVQPTVQQQSAFDDLKKKTQSADDQLKLSCQTAVANSPVARLDTVEARLSAMADAIKAVRPDLEKFYASLSDDQKARFNMMGQPQKPASPGR